MMNAMLQKIFTEKLLVDDRTPILTFTVPEVMGVTMQYGLLAPKIIFLVQFLVILAFQTGVAAIMAVIIYQFVVKPQLEERVYTTSVSSLLVTFGVVFPIILCEPFWFIEYFDIRNVSFKMLLMMMPLSVSLRCLEAYHGFTPDATKKNLSSFIVYMSILASTNSYDAEKKKLVKVTKTFIFKKCMEYFITLTTMSMLFSVLAPSNFYPFSSQRAHEIGSLDYTFSEMLSCYHLLANFILALTLSVSLSQSTIGVSLIYNLLFGVKTDRVVHNPMLTSRSPSHFWGKRWNTTIHYGLKGGVYKPVRKYGYSKAIAVIATFLVSGLLHEYVIYGFDLGKNDFSNSNIVGASTPTPIIATETTIPDNAPTADIVNYGKNMIFFGWNGILVMIEYFIGGWGVFQWMVKTIPAPVRTALVILTALPVAHLFLDDWIEMGYFRHAQVFLPMIVRLD